MNRSITHQGFLGLGLALCSVVSGCAVLTVDVDVYKGSLVNEEHVQLHQLVALATAAKPMLVQLRDNLEWPETDGAPPKGVKLCSNKNKSWYEAGYVKVPEDFVPEPSSASVFQKLSEWFSELINRRAPSCQPHFKNPYARGVNVVLSLYEDLDSPDLAPHGKKLRAALEQLRRVLSDAKGDQAIYDDIVSGFKEDKDLNADLLNLKQGYGELLISSPREGESSRKVGRLMDALQALANKDSKTQEQEKGEANSQKGLEAELVKEWKGTDFYKKQEELYDRRLPFRAVWKLLGEGEENTLLAEVSKRLCLESTRGEHACRLLSKRTKELADAYWDSRQAIRELWEESLSLLIRIERLEREVPSRYQTLKEKVITLLVEVTNVRQIASALDRLGGDGKCSVSRNVLALGLMCEVDSDAKMAWSETNVKDNPERFEAILRRALSIAPADIAHFLLNLDSLEKNASPQNANAVSVLVEKSNRINSQRIVRLGLNRSFVDDKKLHGSQEVFQVVDNVSRNLAHGFEHGRLIEGLHTLTENYLNSHDDAKDGADLYDQKRLLDALVEFAQKVLFLANHESLTSPPGTPGLVTGGVESALRGLFGDGIRSAYDKNTLLGIGTANVPEARKQQYVRVLQAIGNSILFSANEHRERERYRDLSQKKVQAEVAAVNLTHSPDPQKVLDNLLEELKAEQAVVKQKVSVAKVRKTILEKESLDLSATRLPDLSAKQATADAAATTAQANLATFQSATKALKGFHQVLITGGLVNKIPQAWSTPVPSVSVVECFLKIAMAGGNSCAGQWTGLATGGSADSIEQGINREKTINWPTLTKEQQETYKEAIAYITAQETLQSVMDYRQREGRRSLKADDLLKDLTDHIRLLEQKRVADGQNLVAQVDQARKVQTDYQTDIASANNRVEVLKSELSTIEVLVAAHPFDSQQIENAIQEIGKLSGSVRKYADASGKYLSPKGVYEHLENLLKQLKQLKQQVATASASQGTSLQDALDVLSKRRPPTEMPLLDPKIYANPREVMDELIALLRHRQIEAVERFGKGSEQDKRATEAVENAHQHRAGMIYIRPSSAYLRTSFPSTSLQDDPNLAWDNMLLKQGIRNLPFSSQLADILDPSGRQDRLLTSELDKQYWQNVNRVRVSGMGFTNQVLAKDDVGNWYVKQYYGDTKDIIKSAKNLALFNLGTKLPIDLAGELKAASKLKGDTKTEAAGESPPLNRVLEKHRNVYQAKTTEASTKLEELHAKNGKNTVHDQIVKGWENVEEMKSDTDSMDALKAALDVEIREWDKAAEALKSKPDQDRGQLIVKDIRALSKFEKLLSVKIQEIDKEAESKPQKKRKGLGKILDEKIVDLAATPDDSNKKKAVDEAQKAIADEIKRLSTLKTKAMTEVGRVVGPLVLDMLKDRKRALDSYEQAIMFIGDAANSNSSP